jgi:hypothetical protein
MAVALEGMGDLEGAVGAMRTFVHLSRKDDPFIPKARAALWEWQERLTVMREERASPQGKAAPAREAG